METTAATNHVASGEDISAVYYSLPTSPSLHGTGGTVNNNNITSIPRELYIAAVKGNFQEFINFQNLENLLTPNKNTILHIHLTSTTQNLPPITFVTIINAMWQTINCKKPTSQPRGIPVSEAFVSQILDKCMDTCQGQVLLPNALVLLPNAKGETPLHIAARYGHSNIAKLLLDRVRDFSPDIENDIGAEIKFIRATNNEKDTALHEAVRYQHIEVVKTLLEFDPDCYSYANNANQTPLYLASERQNQQMVREILKKVTSPAYDGPNSQTALHAAVINQDAEIARDLLKNEHVSLAVKQADKEGWVPLHYAVNAGNRYLTKLLLEKDGNTAYMQDKKGRTALHIAAYSGFAGIMEMIIKDYPDCSELVDNKGKNALHYSVSRTTTAADIIMLNLSLSNLYNEKDINGDTPLHYLANTSVQCDRLIFHPRVDKVAVNKKYKTALDVGYGKANKSRALFTKQTIINKLTRAGAKRSLPQGKISRNGPEQRHILMFTKEAKESHLVVATLIATLSFAAGITLPGGTIQEGDYKGSPVLGNRASFKAFIASNTFAMVMAATAAFIHLYTPLIKKGELKENLSVTALLFTSYAVVLIVITYATATYAVWGIGSTCAVGVAVFIIGFTFFGLVRGQK